MLEYGTGQSGLEDLLHMSGSRQGLEQLLTSNKTFPLLDCTRHMSGDANPLHLYLTCNEMLIGVQISSRNEYELPPDLQ